jgi:polyisoprenoid-binding protein YceI
MTIRGVTLDVAFPLRISLDEGRRVVIEGEVPLKLSAYGVSPPKAMGVIAVEDTVKVWVSLRGRAVGRAE